MNPHPFPARMRLRFLELKGSPLAAARLAGAVRRLDGVLTVEASPVTGSVLVNYRVGGEEELHFLTALQQVLDQHGLAHPAGKRAHQAQGSGAGSPFSGVADKFVGAVVDTLVQRSALALVAALL